MESKIIALCDALKEKSKAVIKDTKRLQELSGNESSKTECQKLEEIRLDVIGHIQELVITLTRAVTNQNEQEATQIEKEDKEDVVSE